MALKKLNTSVSGVTPMGNAHIYSDYFKRVIDREQT